jgi:hypothetical protein
MWQIYNSRAKIHDVQLAERWKMQTDSIMIFVCLFLSPSQFALIVPGGTFFHRRIYVHDRGY